MSILSVSVMDLPTNRIVDSLCVVTVVVAAGMTCYFHRANKRAVRWDEAIEGIEGFYYTL